MGQATTARSGRHFSAHASLAGIGVLLRQRDVCGPIRVRVRIAQKTVRHTPLEKLYDGFVAILSGAHGLGEINTRLRGNPTLQRALGRAACAEQSVVQQTLDACTEENVAQMHDALDDIYRPQGAGYRHDDTQAWQVLDGDMSGLPCGPQAAFATKGYFATQRNRRGRQGGRVLASLYAEVVVDRLFAGTVQLAAALPTLVAAAERTLDLAGRTLRPSGRTPSGAWMQGAGAWRTATRCWRVATPSTPRTIPATARRPWPPRSPTGSLTRACPVARSAGSLSRPTPMSAPCDASRCARARRTASGAWAS